MNSFVTKRYGKSATALITATVLVVTTWSVIVTFHPRPLPPATAPDPSPKPQPALQHRVGLSGFYNAKLSESWLNPGLPGSNLSGFPEGPLSLKGIVFDVHGVVQLQGVYLKDLNPRFPTQVCDIPVGHRFKRLFILHSTAWSAPEGATIATLILHYDDGHATQLQIRFGLHLRDWSCYPGDPSVTPQSWVAWEGASPDSPNADVTWRLYGSEFQNPRPSVKVVSLDYCSTMTTSAPFMLALTVE